MLVVKLAPIVAIVLLLTTWTHGAVSSAAAIGGEAYTLASGAPLRPVPGSPRVLLPLAGGTRVDAASGADVTPTAGVSTLDQLAASTVGTLGDDGATVVSTATIGFVELFNGAVRATNVRAVATSIQGGDSTFSHGEVTFGSLLVAGQAYSDPRPNQRVELPGLGYVVINEQLVGGDGQTSSSTIVRALRLQVTAPNVPDVPPGTELIIASAASGVPEIGADTAVAALPPTTPSLLTTTTVPSIPLSTRAPIDTTIDVFGFDNDNLELDNDNFDDNSDNANANANDNAGQTASPSSGTSAPIVVTVVVVVATPGTTLIQAPATPAAPPTRVATPGRTPAPTRRR